jgi:hypothetical protein
MTTADKLAAARAGLRATQGHLSLERDPEMCQFYEQVAYQWTIEIQNLRRSRSLRMRGAHAWRRWSRASPLPSRMMAALITIVSAWRGGWPNSND